MNKPSAAIGTAQQPASAVGASTISVEIDGGVAMVTLSRPPVNAIDPVWLSRLEEILDVVEHAEKVRVLRIRSSQRAFALPTEIPVPQPARTTPTHSVKIENGGQETRATAAVLLFPQRHQRIAAGRRIGNGQQRREH